MCGVLGYIANRSNGFNQPEIKAVHDALYVTALRGMDSTGVFYVTNSGDVQTHKEVGESGKFLKTKEWEATEKELWKNGQAIVGHCRAGTRGAKTDANAHPFIVDNKIVLVHNGTVTGSHDHLAKTDVDSHAIAHVLAEESDIATAISKINGAYALVWYNTETMKLHAIRNKERPLWFALMEDGSMMFASESSFIYTACWRNGLKIEEGWPQLLQEHRLFSCDLDNIKANYEWEDLDCSYKPPVREPFRQEQKPSVMALAAPTRSVSQRTGLPTLVEIAAEMGIGEWKGAFDWRTFAKANREMVIECIDYAHVDGDIYYMYGKFATQDQKLNGFTCGWEIQAASEDDVMELAAKQFFEGRVEFGVGRGMRLREEEVEIALFKMWDVRPLATVPIETLELEQ